jgi:hypothetical protein
MPQPITIPAFPPKGVADMMEWGLTQWHIIRNGCLGYSLSNIKPFAFNNAYTFFTAKYDLITSPRPSVKQPFRFSFFADFAIVYLFCNQPYHIYLHF